MQNLKRCVEDVMSSGEVHHDIIMSEFGGNNMGMDAFQEALRKEGLSLECDQWGKTRWFIAANNAYSAFKYGLLYCPRTWGIGVHACDPRECGVELFAPNRIILDGVETQNEKAEIILFEYKMSQGTSSVHKRALARKPVPNFEIGSFWTEYHWVESRK